MDPITLEAVIRADVAPDPDGGVQIVQGVGLRIRTTVLGAQRVINLETSHPGGFLSDDLDSWLRGWITEFDIYNDENVSFAGNAVISLTAGSAGVSVTIPGKHRGNRKDSWNRIGWNSTEDSRNIVWRSSGR